MQQPFTICQLLHSLNVGGAEVLAARLGEQLRGRYRFLFACLDGLGPLAEQLRADGFPVHLLDRRPGVDWRVTWRLSRFLRRERVDLIHAHQYTPFFYAAAARLFQRRPPILFTEHGRPYPDYPRRKRIVANRFLLRKRDRVVGVGEAVRQALLHNEGLPPERVQVVYNGIDVAAFTPHAAERLAVRRELGLAADDFVLMLVARLDPLKDLATAVRTTERLAQQLPSVRLLLVGEGPERGLVENMVREKALGKHIHLLGLRRDVARLLSAADVFLLTSVSEGIPVTVLEAMAAGVPVVSTAVGGLPEIIDDEQNGLLAPARDDAALAERVLRLATEAGLHQRLAQAGRQRVWDRFSETQMHTGYAKLYEEMLHG